MKYFVQKSIILNVKNNKPFKKERYILFLYFMKINPELNNITLNDETLAKFIKKYK